MKKYFGFWIFIFLLSACGPRAIETSGFIEGEEFLVTTPTHGSVETVLAKEGDAVVRDQLLATLDPGKGGGDYYRRLKEVYEAGGVSKSELDQAARLPDIEDKAFYRSPRARTLVKRFKSERPAGENDLDKIKSPTDGLVTKRFIQEGQSVDPGHPAFLVTNLREVVLRASLPQKELGKVKIGQKAEVKIEGFDRRFEGTLAEIAREPEFTPTEVLTQAEAEEQAYLIKIRLVNPEGIFKTGMPAKARISKINP